MCTNDEPGYNKKYYQKAKHIIFSVDNVTLIGGSDPSEGDVHIDGVPIYRGSWDLKDAWVLCKQLGWHGVHDMENFGTQSRYYIYGYFNCLGNEKSILSCGKSKYIDRGSLRNDAAAVKCIKHDEGTDLTIQNENNSTSEGLVYVNGRPVCDNEWEGNDAKVTCNQLGFKYVKHIIGKSFGGSVELPFSMIDVQCSGDEHLLSDCVHRQVDESSYCNENNGAGVHCINIEKGNLKVTESLYHWLLQKIRCHQLEGRLLQRVMSLYLMSLFVIIMDIVLGIGMKLQLFAEILDTTMSSRSQGTHILVKFLTGTCTAPDIYLVMVEKKLLLIVIHTLIINTPALKQQELE